MIFETTKGALLRELARATDEADAFRAWQVSGRFSAVYEPAFGVDAQPGVGFCVSVISDVFADNLDGVIEIAQQRLDDRIAAIKASIDALDAPSPPVVDGADLSKVVPIRGGNGRFKARKR